MIGFLCLYANGEYKTGFTNCGFVKLLGENESGELPLARTGWVAYGLAVGMCFGVRGT